jgi:hypothetical protein
VQHVTSLQLAWWQVMLLLEVSLQSQNQSIAHTAVHTWQCTHGSAHTTVHTRRTHGSAHTYAHKTFAHLLIWFDLILSLIPDAEIMFYSWMGSLIGEDPHKALRRDCTDWNQTSTIYRSVLWAQKRQTCRRVLRGFFTGSQTLPGLAERQI